MAWLCRHGTPAAAVLLCILLLIQVGRIEGQRPRRLQNGVHDEHTISRQLQQKLTKQQTGRRRAQGFSLEKKTVLSDYQSNWAVNNVCSRAYSVIPHDLVRGNNNLATVDNGVVHDCVRTAYPGLWYSVDGTGQVLKASLVYEHSSSSNNNQNDNATTQLAIFQGDPVYNGCDALQCADASVPFLTNNKSSVPYNRPPTSPPQYQSGVIFLIGFFAGYIFFSITTNNKKEL